MSSPTVENYPQLLSLAVHEFRTPASVVGGYLRMLLRDTEPLAPRQQKMIEEAEKSCARLVAMIAEMSDIGKLDAGLIALSRQRLDFAALLADVAGHVHEASDRGVRLIVRDDRSGAAMNGDATRLRNAFDAIFRAILREKAGPATVVAERRHDVIDGRPHAVVVVADADSVQEAYERPREPFEEKRGGLGLALPLARRVIVGHGGSVWSPAPAPGSDAGGDAVARSSAIVALPLEN
jgi:signal transduction histidine kinase